MGLIAIKDRENTLQKILCPFKQMEAENALKKRKRFDLSAGCFLSCQSMKTSDASEPESDRQL